MSQRVDWFAGSHNRVTLPAVSRALPVSALTRSGTTATLTSEAHGITTNDVIYIDGTDQDEYLGDHTGTSATANTITFTVDEDADTPATGDIEASVYENDATVTATISPSVGVGTLSGDYKTGSKGLYTILVPDTATFAVGTTYTMTATITAQTGEVTTVTLAGPAVTYPS